MFSPFRRNCRSSLSGQPQHVLEKLLLQPRDLCVHQAHACCHPAMACARGAAPCIQRRHILRMAEPRLGCCRSIEQMQTEHHLTRRTPSS